MQEIERKFLVSGDGWREETTGVTMAIDHVYVANTPDVGMRVGTFTLYPSDDSETLKRGGVTIKIPRDGLVRKETELDLDWATGCEMVRYLKGTLPTIQKVRHYVKIDDNLEWEIDCFTTEGLQHLVIAEVELPFEDYPDFVTPDWIGDEVTNDHQYCNAVLAETQFKLKKSSIGGSIIQ